MRGMHRQRERRDQFGGTGGSRRPVPQLIRQAAASGVFKRVKRAAFVLSDRVNRNHIGMVEPGNRLGFSQESCMLSSRCVIGPASS